MRLTNKRKIINSFNFLIDGECKNYGYVDENNYFYFEKEEELKAEDIAIYFVESCMIAEHGQKFADTMFSLLESSRESEKCLDIVHEALSMHWYDSALSVPSSDYSLRYMDSTIIVCYNGNKYSVDFNDITEADCLDYFKGGTILIEKINELIKEILDTK